METDKTVSMTVLSSKSDTPNETRVANDTTLSSTTVVSNEGGSLAVAISQTLHGIKNYYWNCYVCLIMTAALGLALSLTSVKILSQSTSVFHIAGIRGVFIGSVLLCVSCCSEYSLIEPRAKLPLVIARGILGSTGFLFQTVATSKLPLSDASFLCNSYPVVAAMLSGFLGMESLGFLSWMGIAGCVLGNILVAQPLVLFGGGSDDDAELDSNRQIGVLAAVATNILTGVVFVLLRYVGKSVSSLNLTACMHIFLFLMSLPFVLTDAPTSSSDAETSFLQIPCYAVLCVVGLFAQVVQSRALQIGPPTKTTTLLMTNMIFSGILGMILLSETVSYISCIGAFVIVISVVLVTIADSRKRDPCNGKYHHLPHIENETMDEIN